MFGPYQCDETLVEIKRHMSLEIEAIVRCDTCKELVECCGVVRFSYPPEKTTTFEIAATAHCPKCYANIYVNQPWTIEEMPTE